MAPWVVAITVDILAARAVTISWRMRSAPYPRPHAWGVAGSPGDRAGRPVHGIIMNEPQAPQAWSRATQYPGRCADGGHGRHLLGENQGRRQRRWSR